MLMIVHKAPNQKTDMSQKRVDFLSTQMSVDLFSTLDPLAKARGAGGSFVDKVPNQKKDMTQIRTLKEIGSGDTCYF